MSRRTPHKRVAKQAAATTKAISEDFKAFAVNPDDGFIFKSPASVWFFVTLLPALLTAAFLGSVFTGLLIWTPLLFVAALFGLLITVWLFSALAWFRVRGWGQAVMEIEHQRRKEQQYGR